jgi:DNA replication protein DnaC
MRQALAAKSKAEWRLEILSASSKLPSAGEQKQACELCGGLGWLASAAKSINAPDFGKLHPCSCQAAPRSNHFQRAGHLTASERAVTLDDITPTGGDTDIMLAAARDIVAHPDHILSIWGKSGNAKTLALQGIVNECIARGLEAIYIEMKELADYVRQMHASESSVYAVVERFKTVRVLCIDEFDKLKETDWYYEFETDVISRRYRDALDGTTATVFSMNRDPRDYLPDHIFSRIFDGRNVVVKNNDADLRSMMTRGTA